MIYNEEQDGSIQVVNFRTGVGMDVVIGHLRQGGEDGDYWHFYPSSQCVLNAGGCFDLKDKLAELNSSRRRT